MSNDEKIYQKMLKAIVEHQLAPGVRLPEDRLSEAFGVSRTGIRKVLQRLALERFVVIEPNKGAHVNRPTPQEAEEVLNSRILLEPLLIPELQKHWDAQQSERFTQMIYEEKEAERHGHLSDSIQLTARFHYELAKQAGNSVLADFIEQLCYRSSLVIAAFGSHQSVSCDCGDHAELITLLNQQETQAAQQWMTHHLHHIRASLRLKQDQKTVIDFQQIFATTEK
ncbi:GntR family transcriptional regulator [Vibrio gazogenes]|uniref:GntR family transcriptional regulator n=1 Tax=Vibrio gazogenes TaxID=687 RepID=A0A1Z2SKH4_VIBGA|nr:GntR family transcriptional regulator [Vibrio gazogenes]ASA57684.1 GntR family transcriptional regulator [Vibrio gazogenes]